MQDTFTVATLGFNATEQLVLGSIFGLAAKRSPRFVRHATAEVPDVFLVDADDPDAVAALLDRDPEGRVPTIVVGGSDAGAGGLRLSRPLQWARIIVAFDQAVGGAVVAPPPAGGRTLDTLPGGGVATEALIERVLVVGADREFRALAHDRLTLHPIAIDDADTGDEALERIAERHYVCVIVDADSRGADGLRVCKHIKTRKAVRPTAVLLVSREVESYERVRALMVGCDAYLTKPLRKDHLDEAIVRYVPAAAPY